MSQREEGIQVFQSGSSRNLQWNVNITNYLLSVIRNFSTKHLFKAWFEAKLSKWWPIGNVGPDMFCWAQIMFNNCFFELVALFENHKIWHNNPNLAQHWNNNSLFLFCSSLLQLASGCPPAPHPNSYGWNIFHSLCHPQACLSHLHLALEPAV